MGAALSASVAPSFAAPRLEAPPHRISAFSAVIYVTDPVTIRTRAVGGGSMASGDWRSWCAATAVAYRYRCVVPIHPTRSEVSVDGATWTPEPDLTCILNPGTGCPPIFPRAPDPTPTLPEAPQNVTLTPGPAQLGVTWEPVWNATGGYQIEYAKTADGPWTVYGIAAPEVKSVAMVHRRAGTVVLEGGTLYFVRVRALNSAGMSAVPVATMTPETRFAEVRP